MHIGKMRIHLPSREMPPELREEHREELAREAVRLVVRGSISGISVQVFLAAFFLAPKHGLLAARRRAAQALEVRP